MPSVETLWLCAAVKASPINFAVIAHNPQQSTASIAHSSHAGNRVSVESRALITHAPAFDHAPGELTPVPTPPEILATQIRSAPRSVAPPSPTAAPPASPPKRAGHVPASRAVRGHFAHNSPHAR